MSELYAKYKSHLEKIADVHSAIALMSWDKETYLPRGSADFRTKQISTLSGIAHELSIDQSFIDLVAALKESDELDAAQKRNIHQSHIDLEKATKFSPEFVIHKSQIVSKSFHAWMEAKEKDDYKIFLKAMDPLVDIVREEAEILSYKDHPYDALLDLYEPHLTVKDLDALFGPLRTSLSSITDKIKGAKQVDDEFLRQHYPKNKQWDFGLDLLKQMGYDLNIGRQDIAAHPFTISFSSRDVRVTTRVDEHNLANMVWSCIHEGGHALYEQGLNAEYYGLPLGSAVSLGIHESQSRLWENNIGRSKAYWKYNLNELKSYFPEQLASVDLNRFYKGINKVEPNLIRTEADELHYHLHVIIRYEIEKALMDKSINTADIRDAWNEKYRDYMGLKVEDDKKGMLQDVHWSHGSIGYFPTYSIGSLYAAQFSAKLREQHSDFDEQLAKGNSKDALAWLRTNIHQYGQMYDAEDLCVQITGERLNAEFFLNYVKEKYADIYEIDL